jgi:hypothetical protein
MLPLHQPTSAWDEAQKEKKMKKKRGTGRDTTRGILHHWVSYETALKMGLPRDLECRLSVVPVGEGWT